MAGGVDEVVGHVNRNLTNYDYFRIILDNGSYLLCPIGEFLDDLETATLQCS